MKGKTKDIAILGYVFNLKFLSLFIIFTVKLKKLFSVLLLHTKFPILKENGILSLHL